MGARLDGDDDGGVEVYHIGQKHAHFESARVIPPATPPCRRRAGISPPAAPATPCARTPAARATAGAAVAPPTAIAPADVGGAGAREGQPITIAATTPLRGRRRRRRRNSAAPVGECGGEAAGAVGAGRLERNVVDEELLSAGARLQPDARRRVVDEAEVDGELLPIPIVVQQRRVARRAGLAGEDGMGNGGGGRAPQPERVDVVRGDAAHRQHDTARLVDHAQARNSSASASRPAGGDARARASRRVGFHRCGTARRTRDEPVDAARAELLRARAAVGAPAGRRRWRCRRRDRAAAAATVERRRAVGAERVDVVRRERVGCETTRWFGCGWVRGAARFHSPVAAAVAAAREGLGDEVGRWRRHVSVSYASKGAPAARRGADVQRLSRPSRCLRCDLDPRLASAISSRANGDPFPRRRCGDASCCSSPSAVPPAASVPIRSTQLASALSTSAVDALNAPLSRPDPEAATSPRRSGSARRSADPVGELRRVGARRAQA